MNDLEERTEGADSELVLEELEFGFDWTVAGLIAANRAAGDVPRAPKPHWGREYKAEHVVDAHGTAWSCCVTSRKGRAGVILTRTLRVRGDRGANEAVFIPFDELQELRVVLKGEKIGW